MPGSDSRDTMINASPHETVLSKASIAWNLTRLEQVGETGEAWIFKGEGENRQPLALYIFKPDVTGPLRRAGPLLEFYEGDGALRVHGYTSDALCTEWVEGPTLEEPARSGRDSEATAAIATLAGLLHTPRPNPPAGLIPLRDYLQPLFEADVRLWPDTARDLYARSVGIAYGAFDRPAPEVPLHGMLIHSNIVLALRGWVAREGIGLLGDPAYDLAPSFLAPAGEVKLAANPVRINAMTDAYATRLNLPRKRILAWAAVHAAFSACREVDKGRSINWHLAVLPNLLAVYDAA